MAARDKERTSMTKLLRDVELNLSSLGVVQIVILHPGILLFGIVVLVVTCVAAHLLIGCFIQGIESRGRVPVAQQLKVSAEAVKGFCIQKTDRLP